MEGNGGTSFTLAVLLTLFLFSFGPEPCSSVRVVSPRVIKSGKEFIRAHCNTTDYPRLCFNSLSAYAGTIRNSPIQLAHAALSVSLSGAQSTTSMMLNLSTAGHMTHREAAAMRDCIDTLADSVEELRQSVEEMRHLEAKKMRLQINDIQTWVSTALTDENTCMQGFAGKAMNGGVTNTVRSHIVKVAQLTSNALALISGLASVESDSP